MSGSFSQLFENFARSKDPEEKYDYYDTKNCACAQFCNFMGMQYYVENYGLTIPYQYEILAMQTPHTWGAFAQRLSDFHKNGVR